MKGECVPFAFDAPPLDRIVEEVRADEMASIGSGVKGSKLAQDDTSKAFRAMPIERAMESPFSLAHFKLSRFDAPGKFLHQFRERVLDPWQAALKGAGFTWDRCYPIVFIS